MSNKQDNEFLDARERLKISVTCRIPAEESEEVEVDDWVLVD